MRQPPPENLDDLIRRGFRFALALTHDEVRADDLLQEAWLRLLKASGPWKSSYLFAAIRNLFIDQHRREALISTEPYDDQLSEDHREQWSDWHCRRSLLDRNGALHSALGRLRPEERAVLYLAAVEDQTAREIGELLGCPRGTVLSLMHRARHKLRQLVETEAGTKP